MNRKEYLDGKVTHQDYYMAVARAIDPSLESLRRIVLRISDLEHLLSAFDGDRHLNSIPLAKWDNWDRSVRDMISARSADVMAISWHGQPISPRTFCWSLSETVCVLKAVARDMIESNVSV